MKKVSSVIIVFVAACALAACGGDAVAGGGSGNAAANGTQPLTMPAEKTVDQKVADLEAAGMLPKLDRSASLLGPDSNANGVRDDIDAYVATQPYTASQKAAAIQTARALATTLTVPVSDKSATAIVATSVTRSIDCLYIQFPHDSSTPPMLVFEQLRGLTTNTRARLGAYLAHGDALDGSVFSLQTENTCVQ